jgi:hypothetical protein
MSGLVDATEEALTAAQQKIIRLCGGTPSKPLPVAPTIAINAPKIVLVKKAYQKTGNRIRISVGVTHFFSGSGTLSCSSPADIRVFEVSGAAVALPLTITGGDLNGGKIFDIEGAAPSAGMNTTTFTLSLTPGGEPVINNPQSDSLTCVEVHLDLCAYKAAPGGADPAPLAEGPKQKPGRNLHLQDERNYAGRAMIIVQQAMPKAYSGQVVLSAIGGRVCAYPYAEEAPGGASSHLQPNPLSTANASIPAAGLNLWAEGTDYSRAVLDTGFILGISDLPGQEGDRVQITVIRSILDVYQSRRDPKKDPDAIDQGKRMNPGRFVHLQDGGNHHGRAKVRIRKVDPPDWDGTLELLVCNASDGSTANANMRVMSAETAGAAQANPYKVHHSSAFAATGDVEWVEGAAASGALRDNQLRLKVADAEGAADRCNFTVANFTKIHVTIHPTPALTPANGAAMAPPVAAPADHTFDATSYDEALAANPPLVLMRNAQPDILLEVTAAPAGLPILWAAVRNSTDHKDLGGASDLPTVKSQATVTKATLNADNKGWFRIRPYIDCNGSNSYNDGEPSMPLNLILADAKLVNDRSAAHPDKLAVSLAPPVFIVSNGGWAALPGGLAGAGMAMDLDMEVTGGGPVGRDGLDSVFAGLINCLKNVEISAVYVDSAAAPPTSHKLVNRYVYNGALALSALNGKPLFTGAIAEPAPAALAFPLLDSGRNVGGVSIAGKGGDTATMNNSTLNPPTNLAVGQQYTVQCIDSPGRPFPLAHPAHPTESLVSVSYLQEFVANFCLWTNITKVSGATGDPADRVYSVIRVRPWTVEGAWNINVAAGTFTATKAHDVSASWWHRYTVKPIERAQDHNIEVRPPSGIGAAMAWDGH